MMNLIWKKEKKVDARKAQLEAIKDKNRHLMLHPIKRPETNTFDIVPDALKELTVVDYVRIGTGVYSIVTAGITIKRVFSPSTKEPKGEQNVWTFLDSYSGRHAVKVVAGVVEKIAT